MAILYKKINKNISFLKNLYKIFTVLSAILFIYIILDMYSKSKTSINFTDDSKSSTKDRVIINPKMQLEPNSDDFHIVISDKGIWDIEKDEVELYNVKVDSTLGIITSDNLTIKDDNMLLEFRGNPVFTLNLEKNKNEKNNEE